MHWAWDAEEIQKTLPQGLRVDVFEGKAWVAVVPFFMRRVHPTGLPCVPWLSDFLELNVRTYVHDEQGLAGVWFYSLACNQPVAVEAARRLFYLNYVHARMKVGRRDGYVVYSSRRGEGAEAAFEYGMSGEQNEARPGSLEFFLLERYVLFSTDRQGRLLAGRLHHRPYLAGAGEVPVWSFIPAEQDGFAHPGRGPDHVCVAKSVQVEAWPIQSVS